MQQAAFSLLICAIGLFLFSTRQFFRLRWRTIVWLGGIACLAGAAALIVDGTHSFGFVETAIAHPSRLIEALARNSRSVGPALSPMLDILCIAAGVIAIASLIAFTPGELIERMVRPFAVAILGAIVGAIVALGIVGSGFGKASKREVYFGAVSAADVHDGDTLSFGDVSLRLLGVDAPEEKQACLPPNATTNCGMLARDYLIGLLENQLVFCKKARGDGIPRESFGRPLVTCVRDSDGLDIAHELVRVGCADAYRDDGAIDSIYFNDMPRSNGARACPLFLSPEAWRDQR